MLQFLHLAILVGLAVAWKWELAGSLVVIASSIAFFWQAAGPSFLLFTAVTCIPAVLWLCCYWCTRTQSIATKA
jgi:hypothetical protein